jgi:hypothetical protein
MPIPLKAPLAIFTAAYLILGTGSPGFAQKTWLTCSGHRAGCERRAKVKHRPLSICTERFSACMETGFWTDGKGNKYARFRQ